MEIKNLYLIILYRLLKASSSGDKALLFNQTRTERKLLETYKIALPNRVEYSILPGTEDKVSLSILQTFQPIVLTEFSPRFVEGDGNCMYRAISLSLFGSQNYHELLRLLSVLEILENRTHYDKEHRKFVDLIKHDDIFISRYTSLVQDTCKLGTYSEMIHLYAVSAAIQIPLRSYYPPTCVNQLISEPYSRTIYGRGVQKSLYSAATIMWTSILLPSTALKFRANHFCSLMQKPPVIKEDPIIVRESPPVPTYSSSKNVKIRYTVKEQSGQGHLQNPRSQRYELYNLSRLSNIDKLPATLTSDNKLACCFFKE